MAAPLTTPPVATRAAVRYLDTWTQTGVGLVTIPLVLWGAASVFLLSVEIGRASCRERV